MTNIHTTVIQSTEEAMCCIWDVAKKFPEWFYCKHMLHIPLIKRGHFRSTPHEQVWT